MTTPVTAKVPPVNRSRAFFAKFAGFSGGIDHFMPKGDHTLPAPVEIRILGMSPTPLNIRDPVPLRPGAHLRFSVLRFFRKHADAPVSYPYAWTRFRTDDPSGRSLVVR